MKKTRHAAIRWVLVPEAASPNVVAGHSVPLDSEKLKHLRKVLRMEWDEPLRALDGKGRVYDAVLEKNEERGGVRLLELVAESKAPDPLELVICLPKNSTMDWIVEKAVECGAVKITPVISSRSVVRPDDSGKHEKRWQAIVDGAVEQSERLWRPNVEAPMQWREWLQTPSQSKSYAFASELREDGDVSTTWKTLNQSGGSAVRILIGPEGGLTDLERDELKANGFEELSLGAAVLRVETAVIAALTLLRVARAVAD